MNRSYLRYKILSFPLARSDDRLGVWGLSNGDLMKVCARHGSSPKLVAFYVVACDVPKDLCGDLKKIYLNSSRLSYQQFYEEIKGFYSDTKLPFDAIIFKENFEKAYVELTDDDATKKIDQKRGRENDTQTVGASSNVPRSELLNDAGSTLFSAGMFGAFSSFRSRLLRPRAGVNNAEKQSTTIVTKKKHSSTQKRGQREESEYEIVEVPGDGNCFFHAIKMGMVRNGHNDPGVTHHTLRALAIQYLKDNRDLFEQHLHNETADAYLTRMSKDKEFAEYAIILAMAAQLCTLSNTRLIIIENNCPYDTIGTDVQLDHTITLARAGNNHYNLVVALSATDVPTSFFKSRKSETRTVPKTAAHSHYVR